MDKPVISKLQRSRALIGVVVLVVFCLFVAKCVTDSREEARQREVIATAQGLASIISETLAGKTQLVVQQATGNVRVTSVNHGTIFDTSQTSRMPYTAQYSVDLSQVGLSKVRYDDATKTMFVELPDVVVSAPNIDESRKVILKRTGPWTSRDAAEKLAARSSKLAVAGATASVNKPEKVERARSNARVMVDRLLELPLRSAGRKDVNVVIRFPADGGPNRERWDVSPSIAEVLTEQAAR